MRHGETDWNKMGKIQGVTDTSLNENGRNAAIECANRLKGGKYSFTAVYTSPLKRAFETGSIIAEKFGIPISIIDGLKELSFGKFEGLSWNDVRARYLSEYEYWNVHRKYAAPPEGESYFHKSVESIAALKEIIEKTPEDADVLVVSHSATMKAILCPIKHVDYNNMVEAFPVKNLSEIVLEGKDIEEILNFNEQ